MRFFGPLEFDEESRNFSFTFRRTELFGGAIAWNYPEDMNYDISFPLIDCDGQIALFKGPKEMFVLLERAEAPLTSWKFRGLASDSEDGKWYSQDRKGSIQGNVAGLGLALAGGSAALVLGLQVGLVATLAAIALVGLVLLPNLGDVGSLLGYSPGTTSAWTRDEGWTVTYANGTVSKQEGDGWTVTAGGAESEEYEDD